MSSLPDFDKAALDEDTEGRSPPSTLMSLLDHCGAELLSLVAGTRIGIDRPLHLQPHTDELCSVRAFLLTWKLLLKYLQYSTTEVSGWSCDLERGTVDRCASLSILDEFFLLFDIFLVLLQVGRS